MTDHDEQQAKAIQGQIEQTRGEMDRTLSAIEQKFTRERLVDQGLGYLRESGAAQFAQNLGSAARQNPFPLVLAGIGIVWLMALGRQPVRNGDNGQWNADDPTGYDGDSGNAVKGRLTSIKEDASEKMRSMRERAGGTLGSVAGATGEQWNRAKGGIENLVNDNPLVLGAIGLAVVAALGAAVPRSAQEERFMGDASRKLTDKAKEVGNQQLNKATEKFKHGAEAMQQSAEKN